MIKPPFPKSWKKSTKPHKFCPGCGEAITLKLLGEVIDELKIQKKTLYGCDIGCMLLSWDFFDVDTIQTHHGRTGPVLIGFKKARPDIICIAFMGDGGAYAIGGQHLIASVMRNDPITVIVANNTNYAMTGGQEAPTTLPGQVTTTSPFGADNAYIKGPEMVAAYASSGSYIARGTVLNPLKAKEYIKKAILNQKKGGGLSFVEILSGCPTNWKTDVKGTEKFLKKMEEYFPVGEIVRGCK